MTKDSKISNLLQKEEDTHPFLKRVLDVVDMEETDQFVDKQGNIWLTGKTIEEIFVKKNSWAWRIASYKYYPRTSGGVVTHNIKVVDVPSTKKNKYNKTDIKHFCLQDFIRYAKSKKLI